MMGKRILLMALALGAWFGAVCLYATPARAQDPAYKQVTAALEEQLAAFDAPLDKWPYRTQCDERCFQAGIPETLKWKTAAPGMYWPEPFQVFWFRKTYTVPETVAGRSVAGSAALLKMNVSDGGDAYADGVPVGRADHGVTLAPSVIPGQTIVIGVRVYNETWAGAYLGATLSFSVFDGIKSRIRTFLDHVAEAEMLLPFSKDAGQWTAALDAAAARVDLDALAAADDARFFASLDNAQSEFEKLAPLYDPFTLYLTGYSHLDLAWLWDKREGEQAVVDTLNTVFTLFEEYPEWIFSFPQAQAVQWMEQDHPDVYANLQKYFKSGRLELIGGTWSEHDSNLPGGEGLVRQFLYGKRYFREKFGKDITVAWTPDSFGYNWNLPQILVKSGMTSFLTQKLGSNEQTPFPHKIFWWQGPDGSRILTYFPPGGYADSVIRRDLTARAANIRSLHDVNDHMVVFGVGNHGGGVTRGHLDRAFALKKDKAAPHVKFTTTLEFFDHLHAIAELKDLPVWNDELYLQHHRGTYTSQAETKKNNRRSEQLLMDAEKLSVIAMLEAGTPYPKQELFDNGWKYVLLNHMHDILPGSGIGDVYKDALADYATARGAADAIIGKALGVIADKADTTFPPMADQGIKSIPLLVFNPLPWERPVAVEFPLEDMPENPVVVDTSEGYGLPCQKTMKDGKPHILFKALRVPALGYAVFHVADARDAPEAVNNNSHAAAVGNTLENGSLIVAFDPSTGNMISVFNKKLNREFLSPDAPGNVIQAFKDTQNAWEILTNDPIEVQNSGGIEIVENGPVRATVKMQRKIQNSTYTQYVSLYYEDPQVYGRIDMDQKDHNVTTKLAFPLNLSNTDAWFEIPYAAISRKAKPETPEDRAKFEVSAHNWVDYTDQDGSAGISLLNNSKYGFDVRDSVMRMTLLRTPMYPDPDADIGIHSVEYALYPHEGDWRDADTSRRGYEFNYIPYIVRIPPPGHAGPKAWGSFFSAGPDNVALTVIKQAEDGDGIILRFVETEGRAAQAEITVPFDIAGLQETNLIEDVIIADKVSAGFDGRTITTELGPFEIKTLKVVPVKSK